MYTDVLIGYNLPIISVSLSDLKKAIAELTFARLVSHPWG